MTDDEVTLVWPERPTCHDHDPFAQRFEPPVWRPANDQTAFRTCSYCGCIHPEDLYSALLAGAKLGGSDWKYGWPHKFYVNAIPNANVGKLRRESSTSIRGEEPTAEEIESVHPYLRPGGEVRIEKLFDDSKYLSVCVYNPQREVTDGKWYNTHLNDLNDIAFSAMTAALMKYTFIQFSRNADGALSYLAPRHGYQR